MTTEIVVQEDLLRKAQISLQGGSSLAKVAEILAVDVEPAPAPVEFPALPTPLVLTEKFTDALKALPGEFGAIQPTERRALSEAEIAALYIERENLKVVLETLKKREDGIKEAIRNHVDVDAEERGVAVAKPVYGPEGEVLVEATPRDLNGHYILCAPSNPTRVPVEGANEEWSIEYTSGKTSINAAELEVMYANGEISREDYLALTVERRVFDEKKASEAILKQPSRLQIIKRLTKKTGANTSLTVRKAK